MESVPLRVQFNKECSRPVRGQLITPAVIPSLVRQQELLSMVSVAFTLTVLELVPGPVKGHFTTQRCSGNF